MKDVLRALPVLTASPPPFDPSAAATDPTVLFADWLTQAIDAGLAEPHAMTVSTVDHDGHPDARVLILKDLADGAWWFAGRNDAVKGRQLAAHPAAALTFYWRELGRQVRVRGRVRAAAPERSAQDFAERSPGARAIAGTGRQSTPLADPAEVEPALRETDTLEEWTLWGVAGERVEFWQSDPDRRHVRLQYELVDGGWRRGLLWP